MLPRHGLLIAAALVALCAAPASVAGAELATGLLTLTNYTPLYADCAAGVAAVLDIDEASGAGALAAAAERPTEPPVSACSNLSDRWWPGQCVPQASAMRCGYHFDYTNGSHVTSTLTVEDGALRYLYHYANDNTAWPTYDLALTAGPVN